MKEDGNGAELQGEEETVEPEQVEEGGDGEEEKGECRGRRL